MVFLKNRFQNMLSRRSNLSLKLLLFVLHLRVCKPLQKGTCVESASLCKKAMPWVNLPRENIREMMPWANRAGRVWGTGTTLRARQPAGESVWDALPWERDSWDVPWERDDWVEHSWERGQWEEKHPWERSRSPSHSHRSLEKDRKQWHEDSEKASPALDGKSWLSVAQGPALTQVKEEPFSERSSSQPASSEPASTEPAIEAPKMEAVPLEKGRGGQAPLRKGSARSPPQSHGGLPQCLGGGGGHPPGELPGHPETH